MQDSKKQIYTFLLVLSLILVGSICFYFLFYKNKISNNEKQIIFNQLKNDPDYLVRENLVKINDEYLLEYLRQRLIYHNYSVEKKGKEGLVQEIENNYSGEKSKVLISILEKFIEFESSKKEIEKNNNLDSFEKIEKINFLKYDLFSEKLSEILFPKKDSEKVERFYGYAYRYLKKHEFDLTKKKIIHLEKARKEIYGEDFERLLELESPKKRLELEIKIHERELSILNNEEKKTAIENLREKLKEFSK